MFIRLKNGATWQVVGSDRSELVEQPLRSPRARFGAFGKAVALSALLSVCLSVRPLYPRGMCHILSNWFTMIA
jgi:hypothetical protein